jgi:hypothetical protein
MDEFCRLKIERIQESIANKDLKFWWVAERAGVHRTTLRRWLSGKIIRVKKEHAGRLAETLGTDVVELLDVG